MTTVRTTLLVSAVAALLAACGGPDAMDLGTDTQGSHSWGGYHWARTSNPLVLKLGDNVGSQWDSYLNTAEADWDQSTVLSLSVVAGTSGGRKCSAVAGTVQVCNYTYGNNGWLGIASIWLSSGHISQGTVKMNDTYYNTSTYNTPAWRALVMCQEIGHTFGLDHQDENFDNPNLGTCMDYTSSPDTNQHPNSHDYSMLSSIYGHTDSFNSALSELAPQGNFETEQEWGRKISHGLYVREFGHDMALVTRVVWTNEHRAEMGE
jgi:hypothetical protein